MVYESVVVAATFATVAVAIIVIMYLIYVLGYNYFIERLWGVCR